MDGHFPNEIEIKTIFGCLPPIIEVHEKVLAKLEKIILNWSEDNEVGKVFLEHVRHYYNFSNTFLKSFFNYVLKVGTIFDGLPTICQLSREDQRNDRRMRRKIPEI